MTTTDTIERGYFSTDELRALKPLTGRKPTTKPAAPAAKPAEQVQTSPFAEAYKRLNGRLTNGTVLLMAIGDFYEVLFDTAKTVAPILKTALTTRAGVPMCGVPCHAIEDAIRQLTEAGFNVALADTSTNIGRIITPAAASAQIPEPAEQATPDVAKATPDVAPATTEQPAPAKRRAKNSKQKAKAA